MLGAVTLVLLAVVFVPMVLDNEPRIQRTEPALGIPNRETAKPLPQPAPSKSEVAKTDSATATAAPSSPAEPKPAPGSPAEPKPAPGGTAEPKSVPQAPASAAPPATPAPAPQKPAAAVVEAPGAPSKAAAPKLEGFAVQVGAFREESRLEQARQKLEAAGVVHYIERVDSGGSTITRLRAGPFPTREAAESARATLRKAALDGQVVSLP